MIELRESQQDNTVSESKTSTSSRDIPTGPRERKCCLPTRSFQSHPGSDELGGSDMFVRCLRMR